MRVYAKQKINLRQPNTTDKPYQQENRKNQ